MEMFLFQRSGRVSHDEMGGILIVARDLPSARKFAQTWAGDEGPEIWKSVKPMRLGPYSATELLDDEPFHLIRDFRAG
jgi:hypothetical protein